MTTDDRPTAVTIDPFDPRTVAATLEMLARDLTREGYVVADMLLRKSAEMLTQQLADLAALRARVAELEGDTPSLCPPHRRLNELESDSGKRCQRCDQNHIAELEKQRDDLQADLTAGVEERRRAYRDGYDSAEATYRESNQRAADDLEELRKQVAERTRERDEWLAEEKQRNVDAMARIANALDVEIGETNLEAAERLKKERVELTKVTVDQANTITQLFDLGNSSALEDAVRIAALKRRAKEAEDAVAQLVLKLEGYKTRLPT